MLSDTANNQVCDVRTHGAKGDGITLDSPAINRAIETVAASGGGTVRVPAGTYLCFSVRLRSNITLHLEAGACLRAARPARGGGSYDDPEPNVWGDKHQYQDFGHSHWRNSLIWGDGLENVAITGAGIIDGTDGLESHVGYASTGPNGTVAGGGLEGPPPELKGLANKAIALRECSRVLLRDFSILNGGHFALLATGTDQLTIENLLVDTNRDGLDIDGCSQVRILRCSVNTPNDDAIVLKTSYALGRLSHCEDIVISDCEVSGFDIGSLLDGTRRRTLTHAPDHDGPTGRIKLGTESNGNFRNITIQRCRFTRSRGLALESVDGAVIENIQASELVMEELTSSPIFLRLGNRARGPAGTPVGALRKVEIRQVRVTDADGRFPILLAGLEGHPIEDIRLSDIQVESLGGISMAQVCAQDETLINPFFLKGEEPGLRGPRNPLCVPERRNAYPEPSMFGLLPASVLYARHVEGLTIQNLQVSLQQPDERHACMISDASAVLMQNIDIPPSSANKPFLLRHVHGFTLMQKDGRGDVHLELTELSSF